MFYHQGDSKGGGERMAKTIIGIFHDRSDAEEAIDELKDRDYNPKDFSIVMKDTEEAEKIQQNTGTDVVGGATAGATSGAVIGGIAGLVAAVALPGLGAFFIGGPIAAALGLTGAAASTVSGAATGAVAGGLLGALTGFGISEEDARTYEEHINRGGILVAVPARSGEEADVRMVFDDYNADQVKTVNTPEDYETYGAGRFMGAKGGRRTRDEDILD